MERMIRLHVVFPNNLYALRKIRVMNSSGEVLCESLCSGIIQFETKEKDLTIRLNPHKVNYKLDDNCNDIYLTLKGSGVIDNMFYSLLPGYLLLSETEPTTTRETTIERQSLLIPILASSLLSIQSFCLSYDGIPEIWAVIFILFTIRFVLAVYTTRLKNKELLLNGLLLSAVLFVVLFYGLLSQIFVISISILVLINSLNRLIKNMQ